MNNIVVFIKKQWLLCLALLLVLALSVSWFLPRRGLVAMYYDNPEWKGDPVFSQLEKEITLKTAKQWQETFPQENFSVTWVGWIRIDREGEYTFATLSDDGSSLFINNAVVVDNGGLKKVSGKVFLTQGMHSIIINCFQRGGTYKLRVFWAEPGNTEAQIPVSLLYSRPFPVKGIEFLPRNMEILYPLSWGFLLLIIGRRKIRDKDDSSQIFKIIIGFVKKQGLFYLALLLVLTLPFLWLLPPRGLIGAYYDNRKWGGEPVFSQRERRITLETVNQRQETFPQRDFSLIWTGWIRIDQDGEYTFSTESDDGSSLYIDNVRVLNNDGVHVSRKVSEKTFLTRGMHSIEIKYFQRAGAYDLKVFWAEPGKEETGIPPYFLYSRPPSIPGIEFLSRNLGILYPLSWVFFLSVVVGRRLLNERGNAVRILKGYAQNVVLAVISFLVVMVLAEGILRLILYIREDRRDFQLLLKESKETDFEGGLRTYNMKGIVQASPYEGLVYELKPNLKGNFRNAPFVTNSRGLRDFEYSYRKPENTFRIVGLGDSSLFGWGVKMEDISLKVLERKLNQQSSSTKYEVINFATPGYNTAIEAEVFVKKCVKYSPDLVIMHFNTNDYDVPAFMKPPQDYSTLRKSYLLNFVYSRYQLLRGVHKKEMIPFVFDRTMTLEESDRLDEDPAFPDEYRYMVGEKGFIRAMDKLVETTKARGIRLLVFVIKSYPGLDPSYTPNQFNLKQLRLITRLSQEKGFFLLNTYPHYINYLKTHPDKTNKDFWVSEIDTHPSVLAHKIEADTIYDFLIENELVPLSHSRQQRDSTGGEQHREDKTIIAAIGDSLTWGAMAFGERAPSGGYPAMLEAKLLAAGHDVVVLNKGIPGEKAYETNDRFLSVIDGADIALIMIGTNDIIRPEGCPEPHNCRTVEHIATMLDKALNANIVPLVSTITPAQSGCARNWANPPIKELNERIYKIAHERNVKIVDNHKAILDHGGGALFSDCLHFKDEGYGVIAQQWHNALVEGRIIKKDQKSK